MPFESKCVIEIVGDRDFVLYLPLQYRDGKGVLHTVPVGQHTDLASTWDIPIVTELCSGTGNRSAILHDYLYRSGSVRRSRADELYREALISEGVSYWKAGLMYEGVRIGGRGSYQGPDEYND